MSSKKANWRWCLILCLVAAFIYGILGLQTGFQGDWVVQDDARQHVFWMERYLDPELFPNDLIADYFQAVAPLGYTSVYKLGTLLGIDPLVFNKLIPVALRLVITAYFFGFCRQIFPIPLGCMIATLLLNHNIWLKDDIVSATPRAFLYPFLVAFLYYFSKKSLLPCLISILCLGLFYPQMVFIASGVLVLNLIEWRRFMPRLTGDRQKRIFSLVGLAVAFFVLLPYAISSSDYAPVISRAQALTMAEFHYGGRSNFFKKSFWDYTVGRGNGVLIPTSLFNPIILVFSLFLPWLISQRQKFSLVNKITDQIEVVSKLLLASLGMNLIAHLVLFRLHLPSRYTAHSLRIVIAIAAGISITIIFDHLLTIIATRFKGISGKILASGLILAIALLTYSSFLAYHSPTGYKIGGYPELYQFFAGQPKTTMIASLTKEADNLPTFTKRSVLVSREYAIPYQLGYYKPFAKKVRALITAQYSQDLAVVQKFIRDYQISHWLIEEASFDLKSVEKNRWLKQYQPEHETALANLGISATQIKPIVIRTATSCQTFSVAQFKVLDAQCILNLSNLSSDTSSKDLPNSENNLASINNQPSTINDKDHHSSQPL